MDPWQGVEDDLGAGVAGPAGGAQEGGQAEHP